MNNLRKVFEDNRLLRELSQLEEQEPESENGNANMTASNPSIPPDGITNRDGSPRTTSPSLESPTTKGTKRKSCLDVTSPSMSIPTVNDTTTTTLMVVVEESDHSTSTSTAVTTIGKTTGRWTVDEHDAFLRGLARFGREWKRVAQLIPSRTAAQVRSHAQKYLHHMEQQQQLQHQQQQPDSMIISHQKLSHPNDTLDMNDDDDRWSLDETNPDSTLPLWPVSSSTSLFMMSDSVREEATRIMAHPTLVHQEVNATLHQLRQRYQELQHRMTQLQSSPPQPQHGPPVPSTTTLLPNDNITTNPSVSTNHNNHPITYINASPNRDMDEQMVVQVLQARLRPHSVSATTDHHHRTMEHPSDYDGDIETDNDEMNL